MFGVVPGVMHGRAANEVGLWVDPVGGNDGTGTGSKALPYQTLAKALTIAGAGTVINCKSGTFNEFGLASATNGLTIRAGNGFSPVFSGAVQATVWTLDSGTTYWFTIGNQALLGAWNGETRLIKAGSIALCRTTTNSYFDDGPGFKLYVNLGGGSPTLIYFSQSGRTMLGVIGTSCRLDNIAFKWNDVAIYGSTNYTCNNCSFNHGATFAGVGDIFITGGTGCSLNNCTFADSGNAGGNINIAGGSGQVIMVSGCTFTEPGLASLTGILVNVANVSVVASDCTFTGMGQGIDINAAAGGCTGTAIRCTFIDCSHGGHRAGVSATNKLIAQFCQAWNTSPQTPGYGMIVDAPATGICVNCSVDALGGNGYYCNGVAAVLTVINCIAANGGAGSWGINNTGPGTLTEHHNCIFNNGAGSVSGGPAATDVLTNPQFVAVPSNLRLTTPGSPCLGAGVALAPYTNGATNYDIGRFVRGLG